MSQAKDMFFELLTPSIEAMGYKFKKSKGSYDKFVGDVCYSIIFSWDGRGGTTFLNSVNGKVHIPAIAKAINKIMEIRYEAAVWQEVQDRNKRILIPQMYSSKLIELGNMMHFKEMAAMTFEEKYPMDKITKTVEVVRQGITYEIVAFHNTINDEKDILNWYINKAEAQVKKNDFYNICCYAIPIKFMCKKLNTDEPKFINEIDFFTNKSPDALWNIQSLNFTDLRLLFNSIKF